MTDSTITANLTRFKDRHLGHNPSLVLPGHTIGIEVRREHLRRRLDHTAAAQAVEDVEAWPGERFSHRPLLIGAWQLRHTVRGWGAMYVALAEVVAGNPGGRPPPPLPPQRVSTRVA